MFHIILSVRKVLNDDSVVLYWVLNKSIKIHFGNKSTNVEIEPEARTQFGTALSCLEPIRAEHAVFGGGQTDATAVLLLNIFHPPGK